MRRSQDKNTEWKLLFFFRRFRRRTVPTRVAFAKPANQFAYTPSFPSRNRKRSVFRARRQLVVRECSSTEKKRPLVTRLAPPRTECKPHPGLLSSPFVCPHSEISTKWPTENFGNFFRILVECCKPTTGRTSQQRVTLRNTRTMEFVTRENERISFSNLGESDVQDLRKVQMFPTDVSEWIIAINFMNAISICIEFK